MSDSSEMLESALALAGAGFQVFPCAYATKVPAKGSRGLHDATANAAVIRRWFGGSYRRNLAVRTGVVSRCWVLDVDDAEALKALQASHGCLPLTRQSRSARGTHYWWRIGNIPVPSSTSKVAQDVDVRGEGGYVLAPPAVHPTGTVYEWENDAPLVEAPAWLVELAVKRPEPTISQQAIMRRQCPGRAGAASSYGRAALHRECALLAGAGEGVRNDQLNKSSFSLYQLVAAGDLDASDVDRELIAACVANGLATDAKSGGMPQVMRTIRSGARAGLQHPRSAKGRAV
jgi:hypothetical protein